MANLIRLERRDGVIQRYRTTSGRLRKRGYVKTTRLVHGKEVEVWTRRGVEDVPTVVTELPPVPVDEVPAEEVEPSKILEVTFYTEYRQEGRNATERYEIRTCVESTEEDAEMVALRKIMSILPDDYTDFLDRLGLFNVEENTGVTAVDSLSSYRGVKYYRFFAGGMPGAAKKVFGE